MAWVYYLLMLVVLVFGDLLNIVALPGLWLMVGAYGLYGWLTGWGVYVGWPSFMTLFGLALVAEFVELFAGAAGSKAAGGRKRGMVGAIVGGFLGAIFLSVIPIPIVAQIIGACLGAFVGAALMELTDKDMQHSLRVGVGAAKGRLYGIVSKMAIGAVMFVIAMLAGLPIGSVAPDASTSTAGQPETLPLEPPPNAAPRRPATDSIMSVTAPSTQPG